MQRVTSHLLRHCPVPRMTMRRSATLQPPVSLLLAYRAWGLWGKDTTTTTTTATTKGAAGGGTPGKVKVELKTQDGTELELEAPAGTSLMHFIRDEAKLDMAGLCDGCMECGTCHVYLSQRSFDALPAPSEQEQDVLDQVLEPKPTSRLACQIELQPGMMKDGAALQVTMPHDVANLAK